MASLDNFHTGNPAPAPPNTYCPYSGCAADRYVGTNLHPYHLSQRWHIVQRGLMGGSEGQSGDWANRVPVGPVQPVLDPTLLTGRAAPDPTYVEVASTGLTGLYVPTRPRTHLQEAGDTAEHKMLIRATTCWRTRILNFLSGGGGRRSVVPLNTYTRYHPYLGR